MFLALNIRKSGVQNSISLWIVFALIVYEIHYQRTKDYFISKRLKVDVIEKPGGNRTGRMKIKAQQNIRKTSILRQKVYLDLTFRCLRRSIIRE